MTQIFHEWQVGKADGDGCFYVGRTKNPASRSLAFQISLHKRDLQLLHRIKKEKGVGCINKTGEHQYTYRVRDIKSQGRVICPIFDKFPQLSVKYNNYKYFKKVQSILSNDNQNQEAKIKQQQEVDMSYSTEKEFQKSPFWVGNHHKLSASWQLGFTAAEGSFYIVKKSETRFSHGFGFTQKTDPQLQEAIREFFRIKAKVKWNPNGFYTLDTTNSRSIQNIQHFYEGRIIGCKTQDFKIWSKSFKKYKGNTGKLRIAQEQMRNLKKI